MAGGAAIPLSSLEDLDWCRRFEQLLSLHLPDLTGKTVLDVSSLDGYFSFAAERFGASRVVNVDMYASHRPGGRDRFESTRDALASRVEDLDVEVLDISADTVGRFDVVLFLGALSHMRDPLRALATMASVTRELLVVETLVDMTFVHAPRAALSPWKMLGDETNWWDPDPAAVVGMLHSVGFELVVSHYPKQLTATKLFGLPIRARRAASLLTSTPPGSRTRLARGIARGVLTQRHLVTHSRP